MNQVNVFKIIFVGLALVASLLVIWDEVQYQLGIGWAGEYDDYALDGEAYGFNSYADPMCTVAGVQFHGDLYTYYDPESQLIDDVSTSEDITYFLSLAEDTPNIEVILLEIDSYGGSPVAAQEVVDTMQRYVTKPIVVQIREAGNSAGYYVASASDYIIASAMSDVGSIGVTMSYVDEGIVNEDSGYTFNQINSGKFKDSGSPDKILTEEERELFQRDVDIMYEKFVQTVATNRGLDIETVRALADGSSMLGKMALEAGLIDEVGGYFETLDHISNQYAVEPVVCW